MIFNNSQFLFFQVFWQLASFTYNSDTDKRRSQQLLLRISEEKDEKVISNTL